MSQSKIADKEYIKNKENLFLRPLDITMNDNDMSILVQKFIEDKWPKKLLGNKYRMLCGLMNQSTFLKGADFFYNILFIYKDKIKEEIEQNPNIKKTFIEHIAKHSNNSIPELYENGNDNTKQFLNEVVINRIKCDDIFLISRVLLLKQSFNNNVNKFKKEYDFIFKDEYLFFQFGKINLYPIFNEIMFNSKDLISEEEEKNPYIYYITKKIINFTHENYKNIEEKDFIALLHFLQNNIFNEKEYFKNFPQIPFIYYEMPILGENYLIKGALNFFLGREKDPIGIFNSYMENKKLNELIKEQNLEQVKQKIKRI